jgi:hypothetical protein
MTERFTIEEWDEACAAFALSESVIEDELDPDSPRTIERQGAHDRAWRKIVAALRP